LASESLIFQKSVKGGRNVIKKLYYRALIATIAISVSACETVKTVVISETACPFPSSLLATTKKDNAYKLAGEASSITAAGLGAKASAEITRKLDENFPGAQSCPI
jgi:hypothetical protein